MEGTMKILIGYDGSECADAALEDLRRAGLPEKAEAIVLSVADVCVPPPVNEEIDNTFPLYVPAGIKRAHEHAAQALGEARVKVEHAAARVKKSFPGWNVSAQATADSPAWALIKKSDQWGADLVVVGAQGHTNLGGRLILGSVSQRVLYEAGCSVRISRDGRLKDVNAPLRIVVGADGSPGSEAAIQAVATRVWPRRSEVHLVSVLDTFMPIRPSAKETSFLKWIDYEDEKDLKLVRQNFELSLETFHEVGLLASVEVRKGNPKEVLVEEAEAWNADCIFVGAKGLRGVERLLLGSVSAAVAARAHCSVEVVRRGGK